MSAPLDASELEFLDLTKINERAIKLVNEKVALVEKILEERISIESEEADVKVIELEERLKALIKKEVDALRGSLVKIIEGLNPILAQINKREVEAHTGLMDIRETVRQLNAKVVNLHDINKERFLALEDKLGVKAPLPKMYFP